MSPTTRSEKHCRRLAASCLIPQMFVILLTGCASVPGNYPKEKPKTAYEWIGEVAGAPASGDGYEIRVARDKLPVDHMRDIEQAFLSMARKTVPANKWDDFLASYRSRNPVSGLMKRDTAHDYFKGQIRFTTDETLRILPGTLILTMTKGSDSSSVLRDSGIVFEKHGQPQGFLDGRSGPVRYGSGFNNLPRGKWNRIYIRVKPHGRVVGVTLDSTMIAVVPVEESIRH